jgi:hypothetical protein
MRWQHPARAQQCVRVALGRRNAVRDVLARARLGDVDGVRVALADRLAAAEPL